ncbi:MAG: CotH kinase family protein [Bacteroidaceae bacterium]|nr:CotH kinase family protein [Bacteroidaceae bacterium]
MKKITFTALFVLSALSVSAQNGWIDMTDSYIINPRFDNDDTTTGWEGTPLGAYNPKENAEHYEKNYDTYQNINGLKAGKYRVSLNAFYRMGSSDNDYDLYSSGNYSESLHAVLYARTSEGEFTTPIMPSSSAALEESLGGGTSTVNWWDTTPLYIPNNMESAYYWFEAGNYENTLECEVGTNGELTIGIRKSTTTAGDWTCLDNWNLEYFGEIIPVTSVSFSKTSIELTRSESMELTVNVSPQDATNPDVTWSSSNTNIATVDNKGRVTAINTGVCYIIARSKDDATKTARCKVTVKDYALTSKDIVINEIMAANVDVYLDPSYNYGSWVELYNPTSRDIILDNLYVTDDPNNLTKNRLIDNYGILPAKGYALLNFDHFEVWTAPSYRQINDKLDCDGGTIIISDGTNIITQQDYPAAISRTSYARKTDGGAEWGVTGNPSPGMSNQSNGGFATQQLAAPIVDKDAQLFTGTLQISVNIPQGATLRYTTDGTAPTLENGQSSTTGLFSIKNTTCYRFRLFQNGYLPSTVVTRSYIYDNGNYPFPIISVVTDDKHINSSEMGVFQRGPNGRPGNGQGSNCNWNMEWDRPVSFEYITTDNECIVSQECDLSTCGGWSRAWEPHSFKLKATKTYDFKNFFEAQLFEEKPFIKSKTLQIRNGGNDNWSRIKDAGIQQIVARSGFNVDYQAWQPVHVFFNGQHYAVLNMREPNNKHYAYANYGIDTDEMDQFEISPDSGYRQMEGTDESFLRLIELSETAENEESYKEIQKLLDIDEYINYMAVELYVGNWDWPQNNVKGFRDVNDGRFRFVLFDLDGAFSTSTPFSTFFGKQNYTFDSLHGFDHSLNMNMSGTRRNDEIKFVTLFKNMLKNTTFRKKFIDTFCIVGGAIFQSSHVKRIIDEMSSYLSTGGHVDPYGTANDIKNNFTLSYNNNMMNQLKSCSDMKLSSTARQSVSISTNTTGAKLLINDTEVPYSEFNGYLFAPITVKAEAPAGYKFIGWTSDGTTKRETIFDMGSNWKYYDQGSLDGSNWTGRFYSDTQWESGASPIGYGKDQPTTTEGNLSCYYFRKSFTLDKTPATDDEFVLDFTIDDGMVIYVNGVEAGRYNMNSGNVSYDTFATTYAPGNPDTGTMTLSGSLFKKGTNVIAVEVHNNQLSSSDIVWDAALSSIIHDNTSEYISTNAEYALPNNGSLQLRAVFEEISEDNLIAEGITPIRINEVSAANSMYINDYFKKNDWIELYNTTQEDIDIAGMYISDNTEKPQKYQVPEDNAMLNTIIPANGYKIIWCDKLENIGEDIHTSFKLAAEGGDVLITTDSYADTLTYDMHIGTQTFGRYPDGANNTYAMNIPTIAKSNMLSSYDTLFIAPAEPEPDAIRPYIKEGGITIAYVDGAVNVKSEESPISSIGIYNTLGMPMPVNAIMRAGRQFASLNVTTLPKGVYVVKATTQMGDECHIKFIIK